MVGRLRCQIIVLLGANSNVRWSGTLDRRELGKAGMGRRVIRSGERASQDQAERRAERAERTRRTLRVWEEFREIARGLPRPARPRRGSITDENLDAWRTWCFCLFASALETQPRNALHDEAIHVAMNATFAWIPSEAQAMRVSSELDAGGPRVRLERALWHSFSAGYDLLRTSTPDRVRVLRRLLLEAAVAKLGSAVDLGRLSTCVAQSPSSRADHAMLALAAILASLEWGEITAHMRSPVSAMTRVARLLDEPRKTLSTWLNRRCTPTLGDADLFLSAAEASSIHGYVSSTRDPTWYSSHERQVIEHLRRAERSLMCRSEASPFNYAQRWVEQQQSAARASSFPHYVLTWTPDESFRATPRRGDAVVLRSTLLTLLPSLRPRLALAWFAWLVLASAPGASSLPARPRLPGRSIRYRLQQALRDRFPSATIVDCARSRGDHRILGVSFELDQQTSECARNWLA